MNRELYGYIISFIISLADSDRKIKKVNNILIVLVAGKYKI